LDETTSTFTSLTVNWDGAVFTNFDLVGFSLNAATLDDILTGGGWCAAGPADFNPSCAEPASFGAFGGETTPEALTFTDIFTEARGTYRVTETTVGAPEPSSIALVLAGVGVCDAETLGVGLATGQLNASLLQRNSEYRRNGALLKENDNSKAHDARQYQIAPPDDELPLPTVPSV
jgi:hypothetical protein